MLRRRKFSKRPYMLWQSLHLRRQFGGPYQGVLGGGIFAAFPEYAEELKAQASPMATLIRATVPPILGGVIEAIWGQAECSAKVRQRFLTEYKADAMQRVSE